jgi:hypothetical protein
MTGNKDVWVPKKRCSGCFNSDSVIRGFVYKDYVDKYHFNKYGDPNQQSLF